ncbi:MmgE/PrpD family protein [Nocardioides carbamazepini]|uniref:MmgE/PrpD family protein n=1 Tax=Nocardioides carbamazepini TaxID=2854259 RepID=UPI002149D5F6|nr:MmgE/PrpD family protein [Nocardioides carbamazepini]MCR1784401.1 MmgE/PrpD family protein [Nocardioides carbamazepini]
MTGSTLETLARRGTAVAAMSRAGEGGVARAAALLSVDTLACLVVGADHPTVGRLLGSQDVVAADSGWTPLAAPGAQRSRTDALVADVTAAHVDELDAVHPASATVPGAVVVPLAVQIGARTDASGADLLAAVAAGYEVTAAVAGLLSGPRLYQASWWPGAVAGRLGAAMTASCLLGLDEERTRQALALAAASAGGLLSEDVFADGHYVLLGDAAAAGLQAAVRAAAGLRASPTLLDGPARRAFAAPTDGAVGGAVESAVPRIVEGLYKEYPCSTPLQAVIRGLVSLAERSDRPAIGTASVVEVALPAAMTAYISTDRDVDGPPEAAASLAYSVGAVARGRERDVGYFRAADPAAAFAGDLVLVAAPSADVVELAVTTRSGDLVRHREPIRLDVDPARVVTRKLGALFADDPRWVALPGQLADGLTPRALTRLLADLR